MRNVFVFRLFIIIFSTIFSFSRATGRVYASVTYELRDYVEWCFAVFFSKGIYLLLLLRSIIIIYRRQCPMLNAPNVSCGDIIATISSKAAHKASSTTTATTAAPSKNIFYGPLHRSSVSVSTLYLTKTERDVSASQFYS